MSQAITPRPIRAEWIEDIHQQCEQARVAFFFKQWGGANKKLSGRTLDGRTYEQMPRYYEPLTSID